jgi:hypothetical protein
MTTSSSGVLRDEPIHIAREAHSPPDQPGRLAKRLWRNCSGEVPSLTEIEAISILRYAL